MKKLVIIFISLLFISILLFFTYNKYFKTNINLNKITVDINSEHSISEFVKNIKNGKLLNGNDLIKFDKLGKDKLTIQFKNKFNKIINYNFIIEVIDNKPPEIDSKDKIIIYVNDKIDLLKNVSVMDNSNEEITPEVIGEYDISKSGTYKLKYRATDSSNNIGEKDFELIVKEKVSNNNYYIKVNKTLNVVMVYGLDTNTNKYTILKKSFVCSAGGNTPTGIFKTDLKIESLSLEGGVWGHFTVRFLKSRGMWFHSVPYFSKPTDGHWNDLEYEEYNKLGTLASKGCIRLAVIDAKWIYDNIKNGTTVEIYESDTLPEGVRKPNSIKIDINSEYRGWDPTDPDSSNPWNNKNVEN